MNKIIQEIKGQLGKNDDFLLQEIYLADVSVVLIGFKTIVDFTKTITFLKETTETMLLTGKSFNEIFNTLGQVGDIDTKQAITSIIEGKLLLQNGESFAILEPESKSLNRSIEIPSNENVIQGSLHSFTEDIETNIGILRKNIKSDLLCMNSFSMGSVEKRNLSLLYINNNTDTKLVNKVINKIKDNLGKDIEDLQSLSKVLGLSTWDPISKYHTTELPFQAKHFLKKGRVILFIDQLPFALILPSVIWDMFAVENDRNFPVPIMIAVRTVRIIGVLVTLISPGLYVALVAVDPEILQIDLALAVAKSREGVPYPAFIEIIIMLVILELILEAIIRLPKAIGPTITMVGGIILSQAAVEAKLVSNLLIIILAATTIANGTIVGIQNSVSIRFLKYVMVILSSIFGVLGLVSGLVLVIAYLASLKTFDIPYLSVILKKGETNSG